MTRSRYSPGPTIPVPPKSLCIHTRLFRATTCIVGNPPPPNVMAITSREIADLTVPVRIPIALGYVSLQATYIHEKSHPGNGGRRPHYPCRVSNVPPARILTSTDPCSRTQVHTRLAYIYSGSIRKPAEMPFPPTCLETERKFKSHTQVRAQPDDLITRPVSLRTSEPHNAREMPVQA